MLLSIQEIELLRLLRWCQYILPADLAPVCTETVLPNLASVALLRRHKASGALTLTGKGHALLERLFPELAPRAAQTYHSDAICRRIRVSKLTLTAYRAGVQVCTETVKELLASPALFLPSVTRGRGTNPWANTRVAAVAHLGDLACALHYVCPGIGRLLLTEELAAFSNNTALLKKKRQAMIFAGECYTSVLEELEHSEDISAGRLIGYDEAYRRSPLPVHLLSCDDTGALQLRLMCRPGYRTALARAALKGKYQPPPKEFPNCDALFDGIPFLVAVDMDLRRIDAADATAKEKGISHIAIAALEGQTETILHARYRDTGKARVFVLTEAALEEVLGALAALPVPQRTQFITREGDVVDAPLIQTHRKAVPRRSQG